LRSPDRAPLPLPQARGMALNQGEYLSFADETKEADGLRLAVRDALCRTDERRAVFGEAVDSIKHVEGGLGKYCARLKVRGRERERACGGAEGRLAAPPSTLVFPSPAR
jgi:hypothetical protein